MKTSKELKKRIKTIDLNIDKVQSKLSLSEETKKRNLPKNHIESSLILNYGTVKYLTGLLNEYKRELTQRKNQFHKALEKEKAETIKNIEESFKVFSISQNICGVEVTAHSSNLVFNHFDTQGPRYHYKISVNGSSYSFDYYDSIDHYEKRIMASNPKHSKDILESALYCILQDYFSFEDSMDFNDFCDNFGYDNDSMKALKTYQLIESNYHAFHSNVSQDQIEALQEHFQDY